MDRVHEYLSGDDFIEALLTSVWVSGWEEKATVVPCNTEYDFRQAEALALILSTVGQPAALNIDRKSGEIKVLATPLSSETFTISVPGNLDAGKILVSLVTLSLKSQGRVRFIVRGEWLSVGKTPIYFLTDTVFKGLSEFAEIRTNFDKLKYHGGCEVSVIVEPKPFKRAINGEAILLPNVPKEIRGTSSAAQSLEPREVAERQSIGARQELSNMPCPIKIRKIYESKSEPGTVCSLAAQLKGKDYDFYLGSWCYGERSKPAEEVGQEAAGLLFAQIENASPDPHLIYFYAPWLFLKGRAIISKEEPEVTSLCELLAENFGSKLFSEPRV